VSPARLLRGSRIGHSECPMLQTPEPLPSPRVNRGSRAHPVRNSVVSAAGAHPTDPRTPPLRADEFRARASLSGTCCGFRSARNLAPCSAPRAYTPSGTLDNGGRSRSRLGPNGIVASIGARATAHVPTVLATHASGVKCPPRSSRTDLRLTPPASASSASQDRCRAQPPLLVARFGYGRGGELTFTT